MQTWPSNRNGEKKNAMFFFVLFGKIYMIIDHFTKKTSKVQHFLGCPWKLVTNVTR